MDDDALMEDLMSQLDSRDTTVQGESATVLHEINVERAANSPPPAASQPPQKQDSKARHRARMVRHRWRAVVWLGTLTLWCCVIGKEGDGIIGTACAEQSGTRCTIAERSRGGGADDQANM